MKFAVAIAVFSSICIVVSCSHFAEETMDFIVGVSNKCKAKFETPDEVAEQIFRDEFDNGDADEMGMCLINCILEGFGALKNGDQEVFAVFKSYINGEEGEETIKKCQLETGENKCETGYKVHLCFKANFDKIFKSK